VPVSAQAFLDVALGQARERLAGASSSQPIRIGEETLRTLRERSTNSGLASLLLSLPSSAGRPVNEGGVRRHEERKGP
jgi:hypothetical protein